jgi:hypothetical protein
MLILVALSAAVVACAAPAPSPSPSASPTGSPALVDPTSPAASTATAPIGTPGSTAPVEATLTQLVEDGASFDGRRVLVSGSYVGTPQGQVLCELLLESYPPQAGGAMVQLAGQMPQEVLDLLESTADEPGMAPVTWGQVDVIGTYRAAQGALEIEQVRVVGVR